jgi:hypothetical protein
MLWPTMVPLRVIFTLCLLLPLASHGHAQVRHEVISRTVEDTPNVTKVHLRVVALGQQTRESLDRLLRDLHAKTAAERGFKHRPSPNAIFIHAYPSRDHSGTEWLGMLAQTPNAPPKITIDEARLAALGTPKTTKFGLSEDTRRTVVADVFRAAQRADVESRKRIPDTSAGDFMVTLKKQQALKDELVTRYKGELAKRYKVTREQLDAIFIEGLEKNWPMQR